MIFMLAFLVDVVSNWKTKFAIIDRSIRIISVFLHLMAIRIKSSVGIHFNGKYIQISHTVLKGI